MDTSYATLLFMFHNCVKYMLTFLDYMQVFQSVHRHLSDDHLVFFVLVKTGQKIDIYKKPELIYSIPTITLFSFYVQVMT